jgi:hypothetical protein
VLNKGDSSVLMKAMYKLIMVYGVHAKIKITLNTSNFVKKVIRPKFKHKRIYQQRA